MIWTVLGWVTLLFSLSMAVFLAGVMVVEVRAERECARRLDRLARAVAGTPGVVWADAQALAPCRCGHCLVRPGWAARCGGLLHRHDLCQPVAEAVA